MFYTKEQVERASQTNLVEFLASNGETLRRSGSEYKWIYNDGEEHDSVSVRDNCWYDHKNNLGGDAIAFLKNFNDLSFIDAVTYLIDEEPQADKQQWNKLQKQKKQNGMQKKEFPKPERKPFILPPKNEDEKRLYAYLCKSRYIKQEVVDYFVKNGSMYQEEKYGNIIFLGKNKDGEVVSAMKRGTHSDVQYRSTVAGSDTNYGFCHRVEGSEKLVVFEAAIDMLSYASIMEGCSTTDNLLTLDGLSNKAMLRFLEENQNIKEVKIALDKDVAGYETYEKFKDYLEPKNYKVFNYISIYKDMNEMLKEATVGGGMLGVEHPKIASLKEMTRRMRVLNQGGNEQYIQNREALYQRSQDGEDIKKIIKKNYQEIKQDILSMDVDRICSIKMNAGLVAISDMCFYAYSQKMGEKYSQVLNDFSENYRAYLDKGKMKMYYEDVQMSMELLDMKNPKSVYNLGVSVMKMNLYLQTQYKNDLEMYQQGSGNQQGVKLVDKKEIVDQTGEDQCMYEQELTEDEAYEMEKLLQEAYEQEHLDDQIM